MALDPTPVHTRDDRRFRLVALGVIVLVVALVAAYLVLSGRQKRDVAVPPDSATPGQVVAAYLDALDARDCATASTLSHGSGGCRGISAVDAIRVGDEQVDDDQAFVEASYDLRTRLFVGGAALESGPRLSTFRLERDDTGAWRIAAEADASS